VPDEYEPTWVTLAVGLTPKEGDNMTAVAAYYSQMGNADLTLIASQGTVNPTPSPEQAMQFRGDT
jgi:hypothetical protein